jgi:hypothetical protein
MQTGPRLTCIATTEEEREKRCFTLSPPSCATTTMSAFSRNLVLMHHVRRSTHSRSLTQRSRPTQLLECLNNERELGEDKGVFRESGLGVITHEADGV